MAALIDGLTTTVHAAFGLFKMRTAYAGPVIRVKDVLGTEADIGLDAYGELDTNAFSGNTPYKIVKWYDQSGNGRDWTNATGSLEPTLNLTENAVRFDNGRFFNVTNLSALTEGEIFVHRKIDAEPPTTLNGYGGLWDFGTYSADTNYVPLFNGSGIYDSWGSTTRRDGIGYTPPMTAYHVYSVYSKANDWANYLNGTQLFHSGTNTVGFRSSPVFGAAAGAPLIYFSGYARSIVLFSAKVTAGERTTFSATASYAPPTLGSTFPTDDLTGIPYFHYDLRPRERAKVTDSYEYEDGGMDLNVRGDPPYIWDIQFRGGLSKAQTDVFDAFWETVGTHQTFDFVDKYNVTWTGVRVMNYSRSHPDHKAWDKTVTFQLVKYPS